jgi:hypothetical protein
MTLEPFTLGPAGRAGRPGRVEPRSTAGGRPPPRRFSARFADAKAPQRITRNHARVIDLPDIFAVALTLLTVALFAAMIWAGNHQH